MTDEKQIEFMYNKLLDLSEKHQKDITVPNMCRVLAMFLCDLTYDCAPSSMHATHLILAAMQTKIEKNLCKSAQENFASLKVGKLKERVSNEIL